MFCPSRIPPQVGVQVPEHTSLMWPSKEWQDARDLAVSLVPPLVQNGAERYCVPSSVDKHLHKLLDRPHYLVMEWVQGTPLDCASWETRLAWLPVYFCPLRCPINAPAPGCLAAAA